MGAIETEQVRLVRWSDEYVDEFAALCADAEATLTRLGLTVTFQEELSYRGATVVWYAIDRPPA